MDGLRTLGVLSAIQSHPLAMRSLFVWSPKTLMATDVEDLFSATDSFSQSGSNRHRQELSTLTQWRNLLLDLQEEGIVPEENIFRALSGQ